MLATAASALRDFGAVCGALVAVGALLTLLTKAKPVRWVGRTLVGDPSSSGRTLAKHVNELPPRASGEGTIGRQGRRCERPMASPSWAR